MLRIPGGWELILILVIVIIIFGVGRLPEVGGAVGRAIREFRDSTRGTDKPEGKSDSVATTSSCDKSSS
mgnify:FL=1